MVTALAGVMAVPTSRDLPAQRFPSQHLLGEAALLPTSSTVSKQMILSFMLVGCLK
jgi:hypothetical protein